MNEFKYKGYEITKGEFVFKWFVWDKDDNYVSMYWSKEDAEDAIDKLANYGIETLNDK